MSDTIKVETNPSKRKVKLNHLVETIKTLELVEEIATIEILEEGFTLNSFNNLVNEAFSPSSMNTIIFPAYSYFEENILKNAEFLSDFILDSLESNFETLGIRSAFLTNLYNEDTMTFYFISKDDDKFIGFTIKVDESLMLDDEIIG